MADAFDGARKAARRGPKFVLVAACWAAGPVLSEPLHTVTGAVLLSPACGGAQREGASCESGYAAVEVRLIDSQGRMQASARTDVKGRFSLDGPGGAYSLRVMAPKVVRCAVPALTLPLKSAAALSIACDSGMR